MFSIFLLSLTLSLPPLWALSTAHCCCYCCWLLIFGRVVLLLSLPRQHPTLPAAATATAAASTAATCSCCCCCSQPLICLTLFYFALFILVVAYFMKFVASKCVSIGRHQLLLLFIFVLNDDNYYTRLLLCTKFHFNSIC